MSTHQPPRPIEDYRNAVLSVVCPLSPESVPTHGIIPQHLGRTVADAVPATLPVPPWSNSAMDGFAVHTADLTAELPLTFPVRGNVPAGSSPLKVEPGTAVRIMTGAPIVEDQADKLTVIPVELTNISPGPQPLPAEVTICSLPSKTNVRRAGENIAAGQVAIEAGTVLNATTLSTALSVGAQELSLHRVPRVCVISTGDELVTGAELAPGQIPDSNCAMIAASCLESGPAVVTQAHITDRTSEALAARLSQLAADHDLIITTGGVSAGAYDVVKATVLDPANAGHAARVWFGEVAQRPGAPQGLCVWDGTPWLALPGNPVAALMSFHVFVAPALRVMRGQASYPATVQAVAGGEFPGPRRATVNVPVHLDYSHQPPVATAFNRAAVGSHMVGSIAGTAGFAALDRPVHAGEPLTVYLYT